MKSVPFTLAVVYWIAIIVLAHFFAPPGYLWTHNTISELASQGHTYKWIMQTGLIGFGALIIWGVAGTSFRTKKPVYPLLPVALYGLAVLLAGIFCAAPIDPSIPYSVPEAELHSQFATTAGMSLSLGILWRIFVSPEDRAKTVHSVSFITVMGLSVVYGLAENGMIGIGDGLLQRLLYLAGFFWLIYQEREFSGNTTVADRSPGQRIVIS